jgi:LPXTG-motif cell wall-anchored protein
VRVIAGSTTLLGGVTVILNRRLPIWLAAGALTVTSAVGFLPGHASAASSDGCYPISSTCGSDANGDGMQINSVSLPHGTSHQITVQLKAHTFDVNVLFHVICHSTPVDLGSFTSDGQGGANFSVTIPSSLELGTHTLEVDGTKDSAPVTVSEVFQLTAASAGSGSSSSSSSLPHTGSDIILPAAGLGAVMVGGGLVLKRTSKRSKA